MPLPLSPSLLIARRGERIVNSCVEAPRTRSIERDVRSGVHGSVVPVARMKIDEGRVYEEGGIV